MTVPAQRTRPRFASILQPGTEYRYSGGGYVIAELLAVEAAHEPFAAYMQKTVLGPMGMTDSTFEQPLPEAWQSRAAVATDANGKPYPGSWHVYPEQTAAGLWTTASDLAKFAIGVQRSLDGAPAAVLSKSTAIEMLSPVKDDFGLGFQLGGSGAARNLRSQRGERRISGSIYHASRRRGCCDHDGFG